jgi:hypothetical protein
MIIEPSPEEPFEVVSVDLELVRRDSFGGNFEIVVVR